METIFSHHGPFSFQTQAASRSWTLTEPSAGGRRPRQGLAYVNGLDVSRDARLPVADFSMKQTHSEQHRQAALPRVMAGL